MHLALALLLAAVATTGCLTKASGKRSVLQEFDADPICDPLMPRAPGCLAAKKPLDRVKRR